jgi:hypothetical protein
MAANRIAESKRRESPASLVSLMRLPEKHVGMAKIFNGVRVHELCSSNISGA